jgi:GAF domain-containing protein
MISKELKKKYYQELTQEVNALISPNDPLFTNLGNISSAIKYKFDWFWVGFYKVEQTELVLNAFQGPSACTRIGWKKGVCGECWFKKEPIIVNDVSLFENHISCNSVSKSEVVFPVIDLNNKVKFILDIDHDKINSFSQIDIIGMTPILTTLASIV